MESNRKITNELNLTERLELRGGEGMKNLCCFWCHSQEKLFINTNTGTVHCIGCKGFFSKVLNRWNQPCKRTHKVKQPAENPPSVEVKG
jgi:hypothetical protein